ncbi:MAG TPA: ThiF family adenylyltransferase [Candidatus Acidoferrales bacterium]|nr:ThiF family adenylyltransferase [Candidatus Acidoferrales bacterium]
MDSNLQNRYSRQVLFAGIGENGQRRLLSSRVVLVGCGALGTAAANLLVRAGVGHLRIIDRDFVEPSNLQRQTLFDESDARESLPKAVAAERRLRAINSEVAVEGIVADLTPQNALDLLSGHRMIIDGTDNFETRFLLNDAAVKLGLPWIYAAVVGSYGVTMTIRPSLTACLACLLDPPSGDGSSSSNRDPFVANTPPPAHVEETCDTIGVLASAAGVIASLASASAIKILVGTSEDATLPAATRLISLDVWAGDYRAIRVERNPNCAVCVRREFRHLDGQAQPHVTMCGRDSVQIHERGRNLDLPTLSRRLSPVAADVRHNDYLLRFRVAPHEITVFADGRAIIKGTRDPAVARSLYSRYLGS